MKYQILLILICVAFTRKCEEMKVLKTTFSEIFKTYQHVTGEKNIHLIFHN